MTLQGPMQSSQHMEWGFIVVAERTELQTKLVGGFNSLGHLNTKTLSWLVASTHEQNNTSQ